MAAGLAAFFFLSAMLAIPFGGLLALAGWAVDDEKHLREASTKNQPGSGDGHSPTALWYAVSFFFGLLGGGMGYIATKDGDMQMANGCLWLGFISTLSGLLILFSISQL